MNLRRAFDWVVERIFRRPKYFLCVTLLSLGAGLVGGRDLIALLAIGLAKRVGLFPESIEIEATSRLAAIVGVFLIVSALAFLVYLETSDYRVRRIELRTMKTDLAATLLEMVSLTRANRPFDCFHGCLTRSEDLANSLADLLPARDDLKYHPTFQILRTPTIMTNELPPIDRVSAADLDNLIEALRS